MLQIFLCVYACVCVLCALLPPALLTAGTELMFICCGWFMGEAARAPIGAWDIWVLGRAMWLNWLIPVQKSGPQCSAMDRQLKKEVLYGLHNAKKVVKVCTFFSFRPVHKLSVQVKPQHVSIFRQLMLQS